MLRFSVPFVALGYTVFGIVVLLIIGGQVFLRSVLRTNEE